MVRLFGRGENVDPIQLIARLLAFLVVILPVLAISSASTSRAERERCYPLCVVTQDEIAEQVALAELPAVMSTTFGSPSPPPESTAPTEQISVGVYGDSRAWSLAEGMRLVPGFTITNLGVAWCAWVFESPDSQDFGDRLPCATDKYVALSGHHDLAIVYAGTMLTEWVDNRDWSFDEVVANVAASLALIDADEIVILPTPVALAWVPDWARGDPVALDLTDSAFVAAASLLSRPFLFLDGFDEWVEGRPSHCQPDGLHFTVECALDAGLWIAQRL